MNCEYCGEKLRSGKRFCSSSCRAKVVMPIGRRYKAGQRPSNYKGRIMRRGYWVLHMPEHPYSNSQGYVREHRFVVEQSIGRYLLPDEIVHHIDGDKTNNSIDNLMLLQSNAEHRRIHAVT